MLPQNELSRSPAEYAFWTRPAFRYGALSSVRGCVDLNYADTVQRMLPFQNGEGFVSSST
jgi:hypothetical protein